MRVDFEGYRRCQRPAAAAPTRASVYKQQLSTHAYTVVLCYYYVAM